MTLDSSGHRSAPGVPSDSTAADAALNGVPAPRRPPDPTQRRPPAAAQSPGSALEHDPAFEPAPLPDGAAEPDVLPPVVRPSVVHIPAPLLPLIAAERRRSGRSNGQILIAAIEDGHEYLVRQHLDATSIGGLLFAPRTSKPRLPDAQPLSPLNIRLFEQDYDVLDRLVAELEAGSRSRLAALALAHYLDEST